MALRGRAKWSLVASAVACVLGVMACGTKTDSSADSSGDELTRANYLIDKKQYSEAIYVLDERVRTSPKDTRARVLLASAYAARAGVQLSSFTNFASELDKWNKVDQLFPDQEGEEDFVAQVGKIAVRLEIIIRAFDAIPLPSRVDQQNDLASAFAALNDGGNLSGGAAFYRALLHIALFKLNLQSKYRPQYLSGCQVSAASLVTWFTNVSTELTAIVADISGGLADPGAKAAMAKISSELKTGLTAAMNAMTAMQAKAGSQNENFDEDFIRGWRIRRVSSTSSGPVMNRVADEVMVSIPPALRKVYGPCQ